MNKHSHTPRGLPTLRQRLPVRLRHYWKTAAVAFGGCALVAIFFGNTIIRPYITSDLVSDSSITNNIEGEVELFDGGSHSIEIDFNQAEYEDMLNTFKEEGEKDNVRADITIDRTLIENVALRLKGNSTLQSLRGDGGMPGGGEMPRPEEMEPSGDQPLGDGLNENVGGEQGGEDALQENGPMPMSQLSDGQKARIVFAKLAMDKPHLLCVAAARVLHANATAV